MADLGTTVSVVKQAAEIVRKLNKINKDFDAAAYKQQIADLATKLSETQLNILSIENEVREKNDEIGRLQNLLKRREKTHEIDGFPYPLDDNGEPYGLPFCPRCLEIDNVMIRVVHSVLGNRGDCNCPQCGAKYKPDEM